MSFFLDFYINANVILSLAALVGLSLSYFNKKRSAKSLLKIHLALLIVASFIFILGDIIPEREVFQTPIQKYYTSVNQSISEPIIKVQKKLIIPISSHSSLTDLKYVISVILLLLLIYQIFSYLKTLMYTLKISRSGYKYKKLGRLEIFLSEKTGTPYAFSFFGRSFISVPLQLLNDIENFRLALKHEIQHLRAADTTHIYFIELIKRIFFINPIIKLWMNKIDFQQELACDEELLTQRRVHPQNYANCLLKMVELDSAFCNSLVCATGIIQINSDSALKRRINNMKNKKRKINYWVASFGFLVIVGMMLSVSHVLHAKSQLNLGYVKKLVKQSDFTPGFEVTVNEEVLKYLNELTQTKRGRKVFRKAMKNYSKHKSVISKHIKKYGHPEELIAVPFVESRFTNPPQRKNTRFKSAGMWQFIPQTARAFDLKVVANGKDERLDIEKSTKAAMRYLGMLNLKFDDWQLAMLSYNAGEGQVQSYRERLGTKDSWTIMKSGLAYDNGYLAKVMAAAIAIKYQDKLM